MGRWRRILSACGMIALAAAAVSLSGIRETHAQAPDGLRAGSVVPYEPTEPYAVKLLRLREDTRVATDIPARYAAAPSPKALAVSPDGTSIFGIWQTKGLPPRTAADAIRMALQHCEFAAGTSCALAAVDDTMVRPAAPVAALPRIGGFEPARMPFWSTASIEQNTVLDAFTAAPEPKALAVAPADSARTSWAGGRTIGEARETALAECSRRARKIGVACVIVSENGKFVIGDYGPDSSRIVGLAEGAGKMSLVYVGAFNCAPCTAWERKYRAHTAEFCGKNGIDFREVKAGTYKDTKYTAPWPDDLEWIAKSGNATRGTPRFIVIVDGKIRRNTLGLGGWETEVWPMLQRAAASAR